MSQHDLDIANQGFPATRADLNNALQALGSTSSGATAPSTTYANQLWYDTANNILKIRNEDNDAWISVLYLDQTNDAVTQFDVDNIRIDGNTISSTDTNGDITFDPDGTGDVIVASGNAGIGTTSPVTLKSSTTLQVDGNAKLGDDNGRGLLSLGDKSSTGANAGIWRGAAGAYAGTGNFLNLGGYDGITFTTGNSDIASQTERMRIDSSGKLLVKTTSSPVLGTEIFGVEQTGATAGCFGFKNNNTGNATLGGMWAYAGSSAGSGNYVAFYNGSGGANIGGIAHTASATSYNTSSDHRLKENVADMTGAIDRVKQLAPKRFNFIADADTTVDGFLAHEAQTVVPEAVTGTHNEVDEDGNAVMQGIDQSKLVPLLTGALKEAIAKIETLETQRADLEARLTALEGA